MLETDGIDLLPRYAATTQSVGAAMLAGNLSARLDYTLYSQ
jgi:hypothetical protein